MIKTAVKVLCVLGFILPIHLMAEESQSPYSKEFQNFWGREFPENYDIWNYYDFGNDIGVLATVELPNNIFETRLIYLGSGKEEVIERRKGDETVNLGLEKKFLDNNKDKEITGENNLLPNGWVIEDGNDRLGNCTAVYDNYLKGQKGSNSFEMMLILELKKPAIEPTGNEPCGELGGDDWQVRQIRTKLFQIPYEGPFILKDGTFLIRLPTEDNQGKSNVAAHLIRFNPDFTSPYFKTLKGYKMVDYKPIKDFYKKAFDVYSDPNPREFMVPKSWKKKKIINAEDLKNFEDYSQDLIQAPPIYMFVAWTYNYLKTAPNWTLPEGDKE
ncbi:MAG: hypothetical protein K1X44_06570 [Alphaproteobacteria bacterium]|nr:hypothetical protein [Alphaproteobacteria bacterium]